MANIYEPTLKPCTITVHNSLGQCPLSQQLQIYITQLCQVSTCKKIKPALKCLTWSYSIQSIVSFPDPTDKLCNYMQRASYWWSSTNIPKVVMKTCLFAPAPSNPRPHTHSPEGSGNETKHREGYHVDRLEGEWVSCPCNGNLIIIWSSLSHPICNASVINPVDLEIRVQPKENYS